MSRPIRIPFRFKILVAVLFVVTAVVSFITFTMARMFHEDKAAYVSDLASVISVHAADEASIVLSSVADRLVEASRHLDRPADPAGAVGSEFDFAGTPGLIAVRLDDGDTEKATVLDERAIESARLDRARVLASLDAARAGAASVAPGQPRVASATQQAGFPSLTMTVVVPGAAGRPRQRVVGLLDQRKALSLGRSSRAFEVFLVDREGRLLSHGDARLVAQGARFDWVPRLPEGSLAVVKGYPRDGVEMIGGFARVGFGDVVAGAQIPRSAAYFATRRLLRDLVLVALGLLAVAAVVSLWWSGRITRSMGRLASAAEVIGRGDFNAHVEVSGNDEMGQLAESFNRMAGELQRRDQALKQAQMALIQSEKMAAFGQLGAGIAHEVKNPLAGIQGLVQLTARSLHPDEPMGRTLAMIEKETKRCRSIIDNLLKFARQEQIEPEPLELAGVIQDTAAILRHQMGLHQVELRTHVEEGLPLVQGSANQLQQVLMNLLLNAEQAIEESGRGGVVEVSARRAGSDRVELAVRDDGPGMPESVAARVFEPFFTTKPTGKGTGLGLSVTFGIVRDHGGTIRVDSREGQGTTFVIALPVSPAAVNAPAPAPGSADRRAA